MKVLTTTVAVVMVFAGGCSLLLDPDDIDWPDAGTDGGNGDSVPDGDHGPGADDGGTVDPCVRDGADGGEEECVRYVNANSQDPPPDEGESWGDAFKRIQDGIDAAAQAARTHGRCEVWVAQGTYYIYETSRDDTLLLRPCVDVYGGFEGTEVSLDQRDLESNETVLDGCNPDHCGLDDGVFHVVTGCDHAVIEGFTIAKGNAYYSGDLGSQANNGGGMYNKDCSPTVTNCIFRDNYAHGAGAGMYNENGSPTVTNCVFWRNENYTDAGMGGGIYNAGDCWLQLINCTFHDNYSSRSGAALYNCASGGTTLVTNSIFWGDRGTDVKHKEIHTCMNTTTILRYGDVEYTPGQVCESSESDVGNINENPRFVDPGIGDLHLQSGSPCINSGHSYPGVPAFDIEGKQRNGDPDMGAYEYQGP